MKKKSAKSTGAAARPQAAEKDHLGLERLIFFSDAVFAIAITLLALDIRLPAVEGELSDAQLLTSLLGLWPKYLGFAVSFLVIGLYWIAHHRKFRYIERYDGNLLLLNLLLLMAVAFIPFPTAVLSEYGNRTATIFYAGTMVVTGLLSAAIWWYASYRNRLISPHLDQQARRLGALRPLIVPGIFLVSIGLAFIDDDLAKYSWILVAFASQMIR